MSIQFKEQKPALLERFGVYYLDLFRKKDLSARAFDLSDAQLAAAVRRISARGMLLSALVGLICVWPTIYINAAGWWQPDAWYIRYAWVGLINGVCILIEFYLLFVIALRAVHEVSELINMRSHDADFLKSGPFSITNILSRAALEIQDPEWHILGIDPFKQVSKKNLLLLGLLYKCKIILTNFIARWILLHTVGASIGGISINYIALPVECFWNGAVLLRVVKEARLRLFGFALCNELADRILRDQTLQRLSPEGRTGCMRAIGNAVVLARYYHPNMIVLALRFQHLLHLHKDDRYDDWALFLKALGRVPAGERYFLLNLFTLAAAFDGRISGVEVKNMKDAYGDDYEQYHPRLLELTAALHAGRLNEAAALSKLDFTAG
jgi:hypothetical protein